MKKIIPFKKDIIFKTNLSEITSISLEHTLHVAGEDLITGQFVISGEYKIADTSVNTERFSFNLPFDINIDNKYILDNVVVDIEDFYYEIINNNILAVNIEVLVDKLEEKSIVEEKEVISKDNMNVPDEFEEFIEEKEVVETEEAVSTAERNIYKSEPIMEFEKSYSEINTKSLFDNFDNSTETYTTYKVYIVREGDSVEVILQKYGINKEDLEKYNDLSELKIGDKVIIPSLVNEKN